jgi:hypothetical protein
LATRSSNKYSVGSSLFRKRPLRVSYPKKRTCGIKVPTIPQNNDAITGFAYLGMD